MVFNRRKIVIATIGERGVMKTKIFGLAVMLSLATVLGACDSGTTEPTGGATTSPAVGEPADTGATPTATTPATGTTPATTISPAATPKVTTTP